MKPHADIRYNSSDTNPGLGINPGGGKKKQTTQYREWRVATKMGVWSDQEECGRPG